MEATNNSALRSILANMKVELLMGAYTKVSADWKAAPHTPDFNRMYYIREGAGRLQIDDLELKPSVNQLIIMPAGAAQAYETVSGNTFGKYWCHFTAKIGEAELFRMLDIPHSIVVEDAALIEKNFQRMLTYYADPSIVAAIKMKSALMEIIADYLEHALGEQAIDQVQDEKLAKMNRLLLYIEQHLERNITVQELADQVYFHPNYLIRFFHNMLGISPIQYINQLKIERAKSLLMTTELPVSEIARAVGLEIYYFSRMFKHHTSFAPSVFRSNFRSL